MNTRKDIREELSALLDGELDAETRAQLEARLPADPNAHREFDEFRKISDLYARLGQVAAPADLEQRVRAAIRPKPIHFPARRRALRPVWPLAAAAAVFLCIAVPVWWSTVHTPDRMQVSKAVTEKIHAPPEAARSEAKASAPPLRSRRGPEKKTLPKATMAEAPARARFEGSAKEKDAPIRTDKARPKAVPPFLLDEVTGQAEPLAPEREEAPREAEEPKPLGESSLATAREPGRTARRYAVGRGRLQAARDKEEAAMAPAVSAGVSAPESREPELTLPVPRISAPPPSLPKEGIDGIAADEPALEPPAAPPARVAYGGHQDVPRRVAQPPSAVEVAGRTFILEKGVWRQEDYANETAVPLARESSRFETLAELHPEVKAFAALGPRVIFYSSDIWYDLQPPAQ